MRSSGLVFLITALALIGSVLLGLDARQSASEGDLFGADQGGMAGRAEGPYVDPSPKPSVFFGRDPDSVQVGTYVVNCPRRVVATLDSGVQLVQPARRVAVDAVTCEIDAGEHLW